MKLLSILLSTITISASCNFSKGVKKDLATGLSISYNGFAVEDVFITDSTDAKLSNNQVTLGSQLQVQTTGLQNFEEKDGKAFPGCSILLTDKAGKIVLNIADAYETLTEGASPKDAEVLTATINTGNPMLIGQTYTLKVKFWDKQKPENVVNAKVHLLIK